MREPRSSGLKRIYEWKDLASAFLHNPSTVGTFWSFLRFVVREETEPATETHFSEDNAERGLQLVGLEYVAGGRSFFMFSDILCDPQEAFVNRSSGRIRMGLGLGTVNVGDLVCILFGCGCLVVLMPMREGFTFVSDALTQNYMDGRAIDELSDGTSEVSRFTVH